MKYVGLIVNPVAGMGGSVGLKGTDGSLYKKALDLGARPVASNTTHVFLKNLSLEKDDVIFFTAPGKMGESYMGDFDYIYEVIGSINSSTQAEDTIEISRLMLAKNIDILIFVGGDGTARNIFDAVNTQIPVIAVPAGVKVFSSVFSYSPEAAAKLLKRFLEGTEVSEKEVLDIDEDAYRENQLSSKLYGYLLVPDDRDFVQPGKAIYGSNLTNQESTLEIAEWFVKNIESETLYLFGPGSTVKGITDELGVSKTLLGIDAVYHGSLIQSDINESDILSLFNDYNRIVIAVTPIGGNGFIFGRGNKQFTPQILKKIGKNNIQVVATPDKLSGLNMLRVDTGDTDTDSLLSGYIQVLIGYGETRVIKVVH